MVAFNAEEVAEVEGFEEWTGQQQEDETAGAVVSHDDHQQHQQHHHIIEGAVMLSTGSQVVLVDAETVDGRVLTRSVPSTGDPSAQPTTAHTFCCTLCNTVFPSKAGLVAHQRREHPNAVVTSSTSPVASPSATMASGAGAATSSGSASTEAARRSHICSMCNKGFTTSSNLHQHRRLHFNERPFQCNQCNKGFATSTNLKQHYRTHTGDRPYPCMYCPKRFATNSNLRQHIRTHTAEIIAESAINAQVRNQPDGTETWEVDGASAVSLSLIPAICLQQYVCNICNKVYSNSSNLAQHKRTIHPKDYVRRYLCTFCNKTFSLITNLRRHQKRTCPNVKHEPGTEPPESWPCEECGKVCSTKGNLKSHKVTHLGIKLFECFICEKRFTTNSNLKQHLIVHDGKYNGHQTKRKRGATSATMANPPGEPRLQRRTESTVSSNPSFTPANSVSGSTMTTVTHNSETNTAIRHLQEVEAESFVAGVTTEDHIVVITEQDPDHNETDSASALNNVVASTTDVDRINPIGLVTEQQFQEQQQKQVYITPPLANGSVAATVSARNATAVSGADRGIAISTAVTYAPTVTRLTKRPVIIKLDVDRGTKPVSVIPATTATITNTSLIQQGDDEDDDDHSAEGLTRAPSIRQPVLLLPPPPKGSPVTAGAPHCRSHWRQ
ncbi:zinc finger protein 77-like isoform X3 [Varroa destructor]|nr:zinc finger protein 77-like isoform X3 [Varroa destructor]